MPELWIRGTQGRPILPSQRPNLPQMRQAESFQPEVPVRPKYRTDQLNTITAMATTSVTPRRAHHVTDRDDTRTDSNDFETVFTVGQTVTTPTPRVTIRISEAETTAIVDSGASCNLLGTDQLASLRRLGLQTTLVPCRQALYAYGSTQPLKLAGQFTVPTSINGKTIPTTFVVIDGPGDILLGKTSSELFGAIHFDTTLRTNSVTNEDQAFRLSLQQHFPAVFEGVGKLRGHQATIHIDPTVTPVAQRPRRVPFALRPKVRDHLKDFMEKDIIEKVDGPSPWVSPVVVTPKPNGDIRLCVDMRRANEAIIRERHPIPTIDEVLEQLNGSTVFSKIDLRWGFHQVELSEDSRSITTFALDENLYRYKRMMFGITSARIERWVLRLQPYDFKVRYTPGTTNIADALSRMPVDSADDEFTNATHGGIRPIRHEDSRPERTHSAASRTSVEDRPGTLQHTQMSRVRTA